MSYTLEIASAFTMAVACILPSYRHKCRAKIISQTSHGKIMGCSDAIMAPLQPIVVIPNREESALPLWV